MEGKVLAEGLYPIPKNVVMHSEPKMLHVPKYMLFNTFGKAEKEEAAAWLLWFSIDADQWVGVTWKKILQHMQEVMDRENEIIEHNRKARMILQSYQNDYEIKMTTYEDRLKRYKLLKLLSLGVSTMFQARPTKPVKPVCNTRDTEIVESEINLTTLILPSGCQNLIQAFHALKDSGYINIISGQREDEMDSILYPTPDMVRKVTRRKLL